MGARALVMVAGRAPQLDKGEKGLPLVEIRNHRAVVHALLHCDRSGEVQDPRCFLRCSFQVNNAAYMHFSARKVIKMCYCRWYLCREV